MIATFLIEVALALYAMLRYRMDEVTRLIVIVLVCLAVFQLAEYGVCEGFFGLDSLEWARIGYVAITLLPPLGIHLAHRLAGDARRHMVIAGYSAAVVFAAIFLVGTHGPGSPVCGGNYVIFHIAPGLNSVYALYYYGLLAAGLLYTLRAAQAVHHAELARTLRWLAVGYLAFIVPTTTANIIDPSTIAGIPSIMCGFAVILALVLGLRVLPIYSRAAVRKKSKRKSKRT